MNSSTFLCLLFFGFTQFICAQEQDTNFFEKQHSSNFGYRIKKRKNPALFQGNRKTKEYFEGWYFKMVSADGLSIISVIPGISLSENGEKKHAFIQMIDGKTAETFYYQFPLSEFSFSKNKFAVKIGDNYFSEDLIKLKISNDSTEINASVQMSDQVGLTINNKDKKIMGWYRFAPFMQCYHGVVSLTHSLKGSISKNDQIYNFDNGRGYIEKDWGKSMPSEWIWMQSNSFSSEKASFMLSIANVPWMGSSFNGFLGFFYDGETVHRFGTYSGAKFEIDTTSSHTLKIIISDKNFTYAIKARRSNSGELLAPVQGSMDRRISESVDAELRLIVTDKDSKIVFSGKTKIAGLEIVGETKNLMSGKKRIKPKKD